MIRHRCATAFVVFFAIAYHICASDTLTELVWRCVPWPECWEFREQLWARQGGRVLIHDADSGQSLEHAAEEASRFSALVLDDETSGLVVPAQLVLYLRPAMFWEEGEWQPTGEFGPNPYVIHDALHSAIRATDGQVVQVAVGDSAGAKLALFGKIGPQLNVMLPSGELLLWENEEARLRNMEKEWREDSVRILLIDPYTDRVETTMRRDLDAPLESVLDAVIPKDPGDVVALLVDRFVDLFPVPVVSDLASEALAAVANAAIDFITPTSTAAGMDRGDVPAIREELVSAASGSHGGPGYIATLDIISMDRDMSPIQGLPDWKRNACLRGLGYIEALDGGWEAMPEEVSFGHYGWHEMRLRLDPYVEEPMAPVDHVVKEFGSQQYDFPPTIIPVGDLTAKPGESLEVAIVATDRNGDHVTLLLVGGSAGALEVVGDYQGTCQAIYRCSIPYGETAASRKVLIKATDQTGLTSRGSFQILVAPANRAPIGAPNVSFPIPWRFDEAPVQPLDPGWYDTGCLTFTDPDGDTLTIAKRRSPRLGSLDLTTAFIGGTYFVTLQYRIDKDAALAAHRGTRSYVDRFSVTATDPHGARAVTEVTVTLDVINSMPTCRPDTATTGVGSAVTVSVLGNDTDVDQDTLTLTGVSSPPRGQASIIGSSVRYTPDPGFFGDDSFTYSVSDGHGGKGTGTVVVHVVDTVPPVFVSGPSVSNPIATDPGECGAVVSWSKPTADVDVTDNVGIASLVCSHTSGSLFGVGATSVTYTATDPSGNAAVHSFDVDVVDQELPVLTGGPSQATGTLSGASSQVSVSWSPPTATDNCGIESLTTTHEPGSLFGAGTTSVTYTATDIHGNEATHSFPVIVSSSLELHCSTMYVDTHNPDSVAVSLTASVSGGCAPIDLDFSPASGSQFDTDETTRVTCTATDACGTSSGCQFNVVVDFVNHDPVAGNDSGTATNGFCSVDVLDDDYDPDGDPLSITQIVGGECGFVYVDTDGRTIMFVAMDCELYRGDRISIDYKIEDPYGGSDWGTLRVKIPSTGTLPTATEPAE